MDVPNRADHPNRVMGDYTTPTHEYVTLRGIPDVKLHPDERVTGASYTFRPKGTKITTTAHHEVRDLNHALEVKRHYDEHSDGGSIIHTNVWRRTGRHMGFASVIK